VTGPALAIVLLALGSCGKEEAARPVTSTSAGSGVSASAPVPRPSFDAAAFYDRFFDALGRQLEADARAAAARTDMTPEEAFRVMKELTPAGFRPRREFFSAAVLPEGADVDTVKGTLAEYGRAHPDDLDRRMEAIARRIEPFMKRMFARVAGADGAPP
jgi:hypothetical protein